MPRPINACDAIYSEDLDPRNGNLESHKRPRSSEDIRNFNARRNIADSLLKIPVRGRRLYVGNPYTV